MTLEQDSIYSTQPSYQLEDVKYVFPLESAHVLLQQAPKIRNLLTYISLNKDSYHIIYTKYSLDLITKLCSLYGLTNVSFTYDSKAEHMHILDSYDLIRTPLCTNVHYHVTVRNNRTHTFGSKKYQLMVGKITPSILIWNKAILTAKPIVLGDNGRLII